MRRAIHEANNTERLLSVLCGTCGDYIKESAVGRIQSLTKLPLQHKIRKICTICSVKPILTQDLCVVQKDD
jgi:hypothetical protein